MREANSFSLELPPIEKLLHKWCLLWVVFICQHMRMSKFIKVDVLTNFFQYKKEKIMPFLVCFNCHYFLCIMELGKFQILEEGLHL